MLQNHDPWALLLSAAQAVHMILALFAAMLIVWMLRSARDRLVRPSVWVAISFHIFLQWPLSLWVDYYNTWLPNPLDLYLLVHTCVLVPLFIACIIPSRGGKQIFLRMTTKEGGGLTPPRAAYWSLAFLGAFLTLIYLMYVPLKSTGLYVLFTDPGGASEAREESLKLLQSPIPVYALTLLSSAVAPLIVAMVTLLWINHRERRAYPWFETVVAGILCAAALLSGAKGIIISLALAAIFIWLGHIKLRIPLVKVMVLMAILLMPSVVYQMYLGLTIGDTSFSVAENVAAQAGAVFFRAFVVPLEVGAWYVHYAQTVATFGLQGYSKLAPLLGADVVNVPNLIGLYYGPEYYGYPVEDSISASAGFIFANYAVIGNWALIASPVMVLFLDVLIWPLSWIKQRWALISAWAMLASISALKFSQSEYSTVLVTHGILLSIVLCSIFARVWQVKTTKGSLRPVST